MKKKASKSAENLTNGAATRKHIHDVLTQKPGYLRSVKDAYRIGKELRAKCKRESHSKLETRNRRDPVDILVAQGKNRIQSLLPIRYSRMSTSSFAFYRGAAAVMASDLSNTPSMGYHVQICGDCHIANFGAFGTPEQRVLFDINDFDETYFAPWEWDLKRLAASFVIASRANGIKEKHIRTITDRVTSSYNERLHEFMEMSTLDAWSSLIDYEDLLVCHDNKVERDVNKQLEKAKKVTAQTEFKKLGHMMDGKPRIIDRYPYLYHTEAQKDPSFLDSFRELFAGYVKGLYAEKRFLLERYDLADVAIKVVGVGSVGTDCSVALLYASDKDPLFLQIKEAGPSVIEPYVGPSPFAYKSEGERVVQGQRLLQVSGNVFLGHFVDPKSGRHYYVRKLNNVKISLPIETFPWLDMYDYAGFCGWTLARAHARSGDPAIIAGYIGKKGEEFTKAITQFSLAYADLNEKDFQTLVKAIKTDKVPTHIEPYSEKQEQEHG